MTHIDEGRLQALIDGELRLDQRHRTERHLAECESCREELEALRGLSGHFSAALGNLPAGGAKRSEAERAHQEDPRTHRGAVGSGRQNRHPAIGWPRRNRSEQARRWLPRAAVLLLFAGAAASATIPGSPVRDWLGLEDEPEAQVAITPPPAPEAAPDTPLPAAPPIESGVSVAAVDDAVQIVLRDAGPDLRVQARVVDGSRAGVYAIGPAASSRFQTSAGRIEVLNARSGELRIELPRNVALASVVVNGREYLRKQDGKLDLSVGAADGADGIEFTVQP